MGTRRRVWLEVPGDQVPPPPVRKGPPLSRVVLAAQVVAGPTNVLTALAVGLGLSDSLTAIVFAFYAVPLSGLVLLLTCVAIGREEHLSRVLWSWIAPALAPALLLLGGMVGSLLR